jgi:hypothetical protein
MRAGIFVNVTPELAPHRVRTFNCPAFAEKLRNIVGLYVDPPDHAVVFSVDEKSQIQALDRTQPGLPMKSWHDHAVRRPQRPRRQRDRPEYAAPSTPGVHPLPQHH